jgi:hypothetical protein
MRKGEIKKGLKSRPFLTAGLTSVDAVKKQLKKPFKSKWVIVACVRKSYLNDVGLSGPSRPDFPELKV